MGDQYTPVSITGYNANPPADDGSAVEANRVKWATIKTKITDPVKTRTDSMDTNIAAAFAKIDGGITSTAISYTVLSTDQGKLVRATSSGITITSPDATDVDAPFVFELLNDSTGDITFDGSGSQTVDGEASVTVPAGTGFRVRTDGTNWFTAGQNFQRTLVKPQGYLTLLSVATSPTTPVPSSDQASKTSVFYRPDTGNLAPIPDGTTFAVREFSELTLTLNSNHVANGIYDVFLFANPADGVITIGTGPVWNTVTHGSGARGTGAGTTELDLLKGLLVNKVAVTMRNGATTYSVAAASGLYVGSISIDGSAGQVSCNVSFSQLVKWGVSNAYNVRDIILNAGSTSSGWTDTPTTWRQSEGSTNNSLFVFSGIAQSYYDIMFSQIVQSACSNSTSSADIGIGVNSTTAPSGPKAQQYVNSLTTVTIRSTLVARHRAAPALGIQRINMIEQAANGATNNTYFGTEANMLMTAKWLG